MLRVPFLHTAWFRIEPENSGVECVKQLTLCRSFKSQPIEIVLLEAKSGVWEGAYVQVGGEWGPREGGRGVASE
jgi:hypothetical protein